MKIQELKIVSDRTIIEKRQRLFSNPSYLPAYGFRMARVERELLKLTDTLLSKGLRVFFCGTGLIRGVSIWSCDLSLKTSIYFTEVPYRYQVENNNDVLFDEATMLPEISVDKLISCMRKPSHLDIALLNMNKEIKL